jgi:ABC-type dipeptide/oligopeptide/nickel transport system permease component
MILALVMVYSTLVLTLNLIVDLLYGVVDPRIDVTASK